MRKLGLFVVAALVIVAGSTDVFAQSAKFAAQVSNVTLVAQTAGAVPPVWQTVLSTTIKTPNKKDLLIGGSLETGLYTQTQVKGKLGATDTATASATLEVRLLVDDQANVAFPNEVVYDKRLQTLSATLGGVITSCQDLNADGKIDVATECTVTDEQINLLLDTMAAHHFNFVVANLTPGSHRVDLQVRIGTTADAGAGSASALAGVGRGSVTVEQVQATNFPDGINFLQ